MDFLVNMGDSWLSNTPRRGSVALRTTMQHSETQLCIACHPAQFTVRGYVTAVKNGYAPTQRPQLEFLADRLYNNARPLYGEPNTNWVRVIYTARTVSSRIPLLTDQFEQNITHDKPRQNFSTPYAQFLKIHYKNLKEMPGDEADGCEPDVSPFEIATQSWQTFDMVYKQTKDQQWINQRDHVEQLALAYEPKNMIDLNWKIMLLIHHRQDQIPIATRSTDHPALRIRNPTRRVALSLRQKSQDCGLHLLQRRLSRCHGRPPPGDR